MSAAGERDPVWSQWRRPPPTRAQRWHDVWVALAVVAGAMVMIVLVNSMGAFAFGSAPSLGEQFVLGAAVSLPLVVRRRYPIAVLLFVVAQVRLFTGDAQAWEALVSLGLLAVTVVLVVLLASRLYSGSLLQTVGRVALRKAWERAD